MDENPFNDPKIAQDWILRVESEKARSREADIYPRLNAWVKACAPLEILEIGAGQGICSDKIDLNGRRYTGLEPSPLLLERAKKVYTSEDRHFVTGTACELPFLDDTFDAVFSVVVWHFLGDPKKAADEISRVLKANGRFLIITANPSAYSLWTEGYTDIQISGRRLEGKAQLEDQSWVRESFYVHTLDEILDSFRAAHLQVQKTETFRASEKLKEQKYFVSIQGQKPL